ncbi:hypothetical protein CCH79_00001821, partial [Gambusia affinis]
RQPPQKQGSQQQAVHVADALHESQTVTTIHVHAAGNPPSPLTYGELDWLNVSHCQGIPRHHCDLSGATSDVREWYYARVRVSCAASGSKSAWAMSRRFSPRWNTKISPPSVRLNSTKQGLVVQVKASRVLMRKVHSGVDNNIYVVHPGGQEEVYEVASGSKLTLTEVKPRTHYCVQAQTVVPRHMKSSDRSAAKCITTD